MHKRFRSSSQHPALSRTKKRHIQWHQDYSTSVKQLRLCMYSRITSTKFLTFCMTTFCASLTNLKALLLQSRDYNCYVSRPTLAPPPLWLQKHADLRAHDFTHSTDLWHQPRLANVTCVWSLRRFRINPTITIALVLGICMLSTRCIYMFLMVLQIHNM